MFLGTDKDFRKGVPTKTPLSRTSRTNTPGNNASESKTPHSSAVIDVVEQAKVDREQRQLVRLQTSNATVIQAWWRGRRIAFRHLQGLRNTFDAKMVDIGKVSALLQSKGIVFIPTVPIVVELYYMLLFRNKCEGLDCSRVVSFLSTVLGPSLGQMDASKNCITSFMQTSLPYSGSIGIAAVSSFKSLPIYRLYKFVILALQRMSLSKVKIPKAQADKLIDLSIFLQYLCGCNRPIRMRYPEVIENLFIRVRFELVNLGLFQDLRCVLSQLAVTICNETVTSDTNDFSNSSSSGYLKFVSYGNTPRIVSDGTVEITLETVGDVMINLVMNIIDNDQSYQMQRVILFTREFLSVEALTMQLSVSICTRLASWTMLETILNVILSQLNQLALPPSRHTVFKSGQWLLGNISSLSSYLRLDMADDDSLSTSTTILPSTSTSTSITSTSTSTVSDEVLRLYLLLCSELMIKYSVSGVVQGISGVVMMSEGSHMIAAGVPIALRDQIMCLIHPTFTKRCYNRVMLPLQNDISMDSFARSEDIADIAHAFSQNSIRFVGSELMEQQSESTWFTSKWAQKMLSSVTGGSFSSSKKSIATTSSATTGVISASLSSSAAATSNPSQVLEESASIDRPFNVLTFKALCRLWAIFLPPAAVLATPDSKPWKHLTVLAFSTKYDMLYHLFSCIHLNV